MVTKISKPKQDWHPRNPLEIAIFSKFEKLYTDWYESQPPRTGLHVSSITVSDDRFCLRQLVLMQFFPHAEVRMYPPTIRIFYQGWVIHQKWQKLFEDAGIALETETGHSHSSGATFTPDAVIKILGRKFIVEIKSMNTDAYDSMKSVHADAEIQANMYMHLTGIRQSIVLVENKNDQKFKLWVIEYNEKLISKYIKRLSAANIGVVAFKESKGAILPHRHIKCPHPVATKVKNCPVAEACFAGKFERKEMLNAYRKKLKAEGAA